MAQGYWSSSKRVPSAVLAYAVAFNGTIPPSTSNEIFFTTTNGYDSLGEYNNSTGRFTAQEPIGAPFAIYAFNFHLKMTSATAIGVDKVIELRLTGSTGDSAFKCQQDGNGSTSLIFKGSIITRHITGGGYMLPRVTHNHDANIVISNSAGAASASYMTVTRLY